MYGAIFWVILFICILPCTLACAARRLKFWKFFGGVSAFWRSTQNTASSAGDAEEGGTALGLEKDADASTVTPKKTAILLSAAIGGAILLAYFMAAAVTAVYVGAAIDLFPGDTWETCGKSEVSKTDGKTKCNWKHYDLIPPKSEEIKFKSSDGTTDLVGWWLNASTPSKPAVAAMLYHHGSGLNIAAEYREVRYDIFLKHGISVFTYDYPGYGKSSGTASEESVNLASKGALAWLMAKTGATSPSDLLQLGRSLGGAVAIRLASDLGKEGKGFKGTIIQSAFSTYADAVGAFFPTTAWAAKSVVGPMFNSVSYVSNGKGCFFHYHGEDDEWVPVSQGDTLYDAAQKGDYDKQCMSKYRDSGVLHDAPMTDGLIKEIFITWMRDGMKIPVWT